MTLLHEVGEADSISVAELAARLGWTKPMVYRLVRTLEASGGLRQTDGGYSLGPAILSLGFSALKSLRMTDLARLALKTVHEQTGESTILTILDGIDAVYIDFIETDHLLVFRTPRLGSRLSAAHTSSGHALLSRHSHESLAALFKDYKFDPPTGHGVQSLAALEERLEQVRTRGYALVNEEVISGHRAVAAPLLDHAGVAAAISISVPSARVTLSQLKSMAESSLLPATRSVSIKLGYN